MEQTKESNIDLRQYFVEYYNCLIAWISSITERILKTCPVYIVCLLVENLTQIKA